MAQEQVRKRKFNEQCTDEKLYYGRLNLKLDCELNQQSIYNKLNELSVFIEDIQTHIVEYIGNIYQLKQNDEIDSLRTSIFTVIQAIRLRFNQSSTFSSFPLFRKTDGSWSLELNELQFTTTNKVNDTLILKVYEFDCSFSFIISKYALIASFPTKIDSERILKEILIHLTDFQESKFFEDIRLKGQQDSRIDFILLTIVLLKTDKVLAFQDKNIVLDSKSLTEYLNCFTKVIVTSYKPLNEKIFS